MLTYLKAKLRTRWTQSEKKSQRSDEDYLIFHGSHEHFLKNGAWLLEESIALFHGKANPFRHVSVTDLNGMNVEKVPHNVQVYSYLYKGSWEGKSVLVKKAKYSKPAIEGLLHEIMVATQMATHSNVHRILGCCLETECPVLLYEWIEMGSLQDWFDQNKNVVLKWKERLRIAWEISHAVAYLHTAFPRPIIHRILAPRSVFLDQSDAAKLSNFSFCVSIPEGEEFVKEDAVIGIVGYLAPEYSKSFNVAESIDVYSYGVLLIMLVTGKGPYIQTDEQGQEEHLTTWVPDSIKDNCIANVVDPTLIDNAVSAIEDLQLRASIQLALQCVAQEIDYRPSMVEVATMLKNIIAYPESILDCSFFKEGTLFRVFCGSKENFVRNEAMVIQESMSFFYGRANPVCYFSVDDLNSMNVKFSVCCSHKHFNWYQGSWEGKDVLLKLPKAHMKGSRSSDEILLMYVREIVVATQMATLENVHKLIGCCLETATPILVYEWVPCQTLKDHMNPKILPPLEWKDRLRIAWEICHVVSYLHSSFPRPIVYRFLEPENIFLDQKRSSKMCNFCHSAYIPEGEDLVKVCTLIDWTNDYMAPEYYNHGKVAKWTDVYSFGILFLEFLTGMQATGLIDWIIEEIRKDGISLIIDPEIIKKGESTTEVRASLELALRCIVTEEDNRPTMEDIATELNNIIRSSGSYTSL